MTFTREEWLREIADWKLEAADENTSRYFYELRGVEEVQKGKKAYVIGRKGAGKTAIAEHIRSLSGPKVFIRSLSFKNFPFNDLYKLNDNSYTAPSQYKTIWKYIIYSSICSMMCENEVIDNQIRSELDRHFNLDVERGLARSLTKISDISGGFTIFGSGANGSTKKVVVPNDATWQDRVDILERIIVNYLDDSEYYVVFDELDEDYKDVVDASVSKKYLELLIGLFKATQDVRRLLRRNFNILPLIFLRSDIYELLYDNDKNKWRDFALDLTWSEPNLRHLLAFRLSRAQIEDGPILTFNEVIDELFTTDTTRAGGARRQRHVFAYILAHTLRRPRDVISYLRECASFALSNGSGKISPSHFSDVNRAYSLRLRQEFVDEMQGAVPEIDKIFNLLSRMRKQIFSFREFETQFDRSIRSNELDPDLDFKTICRILFHYSSIGNQPSQRSAKIFQYIYPNAVINFDERAVIHPGLLQSLQIN